jgi:hypothetical protein
LLATGIQPAEVLDQIAQAVNRAEETFLKQNFVVLSGSASVTLKLNVAGMEGPEATIALQIGQRPYA